MNSYSISGIQQIGIGVSSLDESWSCYRTLFGVDCRIFEDSAVAELMLPHTGGEARERHAVLAVNLQGGGGFEVWQYTGGKPQPPSFTLSPGDIGIYACKIKVKDIDSATSYIGSKGGTILSGPSGGPDGAPVSYIADPFGNIFQLRVSDSWLLNEKRETGGVYGAVIGVSDIDNAVKFYGDILGYDNIIYDQRGRFSDLAPLPGGGSLLRRVLLAKSQPSSGAFSPLFGPSEVELIRSEEREPEKIFGGRYWGDLGFMHLCFDVSGMDALRSRCSVMGFPFSVDSSDSRKGTSFDMGEAAGHFAYISDPDGTLIEFVETHKIPVIKRLGWYLDLRKRGRDKPLPLYFFRAMRFSKVR